MKAAILSIDDAEPVDSSSALLDDRQQKLDAATAIPNQRKRAPSALVPPDPAQFTTGPSTEPIWLTTGSQQQGQREPVQRTGFEQSDADVALRATGELTPPADEATGDSESSVISDFADTPDGWLAQAQDLARTAKSQEELATVTALCQRVIEANPPTQTGTSASRLASWAHNRRGEMLAEAGRSDEAVNEFQAAVMNNPENALAIHNRAVTLAQRNDFDAALIDFNRVIELNPGLGIAYRNRAELLVAQGKTSEAVADYTRAIDAMPEDAELYRARAHALQQLGRFEPALADLDQSIQLAPKVAQTYTQRANLLADQGDYAGALDQFTQSLALDANLAETHRGLAWLKATCPDERYRDVFEALDAAKKAVKLSPAEDYTALDGLAAAHANAGEFEKAIAIVQQAIIVAPPDALPPMQARLELYRQRQPFRATVQQ